MQVMLCSGVLPKPMPGSSTMRSRAMPARAAMSSERAKNAVTSAMMSIAGSAASRLCMTMTGTPCSATTRAMSGSRCRPHTSLTIAAPASSAQAATAAFMRVDRDRDAERDDVRQDRRKPRALLVERHADRTAIGAGRFRADVEDVGAFGGKPPRMRDGRLRIEKAAAVGKGIRRDIEHAHDQRPRLWRAVRQTRWRRAPTA